MGKPLRLQKKMNGQFSVLTKRIDQDVTCGAQCGMLMSNAIIVIQCYMKFRQILPPIVHK